MKNEKPIFICGFTRGGSNIFLNLLLTHPEVCSPAHELQEVFLGDPSTDTPRYRRFRRYVVAAPLVLLAGQNFIRMSNLETRKPFSPVSQYLIDRAIYAAKFSTRSGHENLNLFKYEGQEYLPDEIRRARIVTKVLNGLVLLTDNLIKMYPDAVFYGLTRNGLAVCQGHVRRGLLDAEDFAVLYKRIGEAMLDYSRREKSFHLYRFNDVISDPIGTIRSTYMQADLDISLISKIRLQSKSTLTRGGVSKQSGAYDRQLQWYTDDEIGRHFRPDIDSIQQNQLSKRDRNTFLSIAGDTMEKLGYSTNTN
jgi:hypothetical protein